MGLLRVIFLEVIDLPPGRNRSQDGETNCRLGRDLVITVPWAGEWDVLHCKATGEIARADKSHAHYLRWMGQAAGGSPARRGYTYRHPKLTTNLVVSDPHFGANASYGARNSIKLLAFLLLRSG